jgi:hypothetical protein
MCRRASASGWGSSQAMVRLRVGGGLDSWSEEGESLIDGCWTFHILAFLLDSLAGSSCPALLPGEIVAVRLDLQQGSNPVRTAHGLRSFGRRGDQALVGSGRRRQCLATFFRQDRRPLERARGPYTWECQDKYSQPNPLHCRDHLKQDPDHRRSGMWSPQTGERVANSVAREEHQQERDNRPIHSCDLRQNSSRPIPQESRDTSTFAMTK